MDLGSSTFDAATRNAAATFESWPSLACAAHFTVVATASECARSTTRRGAIETAASSWAIQAFGSGLSQLACRTRDEFGKRTAPVGHPVIGLGIAASRHRKKVEIAVGLDHQASPNTLRKIVSTCLVW